MTLSVAIPMQDTTPDKKTYRYNAFISYNRAEDDKLAAALHHSLHRFAKPFYRIRALRVFLDETSLSANPAIWKSIERALSNSEYFLLLASPSAAESRWVEREVKWWLNHRAVEKMLIVVTDGKLVWDENLQDFDWQQPTVLPAILRGRFRDEPVFVDLRRAKTDNELTLRYPRFRSDVGSIAAPLHGRPKEELDSEDVRQHRITRAVASTTVAAILVFAVVSVWQWRVASAAKDTAFSRELAAQASGQLTVNPELSVLLALEAIRESKTEEAENVLRQALATSHIRGKFPHPSVVSAVVFDAKEKWVSTISGDSVRVWDTLTGDLLRTLSDDSEIVSAAFIAESRQMVTADSGSTITVWDLESGNRITSMHGHQGQIDHIAPSPDGTLLVTAGREGGAVLWDLSRGLRLLDLRAATDGQSRPAWTKDGNRIIPESPADGIQAAFSPDGKLIATGSRMGPAYIWDTTDGSLIATLKGHTTHVNSIAFSPDGERVVTASHDRTARIWSARSAQQLAVLKGHAGVVSRADFTPDGFSVVTASSDGIARIWDSTTGALTSELRGHTSIITSIAFSPGGKYVLTASADRTARVWNLRTGRLTVTFLGHEGGIRNAQFSPSGRQVATAGVDGTARLWTLDFAELLGHEDGLLAVAFSKDSKLIVTGSKDNTARVWDTYSGAQLHILHGHEGPVNRVVFDQQSELIATGSFDMTARVWSATTGDVLAQFDTNSGPLNFVAISPDGSLIATQGSYGSARNNAMVSVWSTETGELVAKREAHVSAVLDAKFSSDGDYLLTRGQDNIVRVWKTGTWHQIWEHGGSSEQVRDAAFSPDSRYVLTSYAIGGLHLWNVATGTRVPNLAGKEESTVRAWFAPHLFSPEYRLTVEFSGDHARIVEARTKRKLRDLPGHTGRINAVTVSPDGKLVATASEDGTARVSSCESCAPLGRLLEIGRTRVTRSLNEKERRAYLHERVSSK